MSLAQVQPKRISDSGAALIGIGSALATFSLFGTTSYAVMGLLSPYPLGLTPDFDQLISRLGEFIFPLVPMLLISASLFSTKKRIFALVASLMVFLGLTAQLAGTVLGGYYRVEEQLLGIISGDYDRFEAGYMLVTGLVGKLGVYIALAGSVLAIVQFFKQGSKRVKTAPYLVPTTPVATQTSAGGFDPMTGQPLQRVQPLGAKFDPMTGQPLHPSN